MSEIRIFFFFLNNEFCPEGLFIFKILKVFDTFSQKEMNSALPRVVRIIETRNNYSSKIPQRTAPFRKNTLKKKNYL